MENDLLEKINNMAEKREAEKNKKDNEYINTILNTYNKLKKHFKRFDKDIEILKTGVDKGILNFSYGLYESEMYKKFSANCITHGVGFTRLRNNNFGLGQFGGGYCGEVGILYKNGKIYLTTSDWYDELLLELNSKTTKDDILNNTHIAKNLDKFAKYCECFSNNILDELDEFENYIRDEV